MSFQFVLVIDESMVDEAGDARRAQDVSEGLAQLVSLALLHIRTDSIDAVFGELDFPSMRIAGIILA